MSDLRFENQPLKILPGKLYIYEENVHECIH